MYIIIVMSLLWFKHCSLTSAVVFFASLYAGDSTFNITPSRRNQSND